MLSFYLIGFKQLFNIGKKIFLVLAVYLVVISLFLHFIAKDKPKITVDPIKKNREEIYKAINDPQLNKTEEGKLVIALYRSMLCGLIGEACTDNPDDGDKNFSHSLFGFMTNLLISPYANPPASGVYWAYSGLQNAGFVPKTYAAEGIGFAAIKPLMNVWKVFRDLSYMLLVLVLIAIGFMIMFRAKINAQTVISIENSLPKIVIALLLITFSFPIAGFLIDLMYVAIGVVILVFDSLSNEINLLGNYKTFSDKINLFYYSSSSDIWKLTNPLSNRENLWNLSKAIFGLMPSMLRIIISIIIGLIFPPSKLISLVAGLGTSGGTIQNVSTIILPLFHRLRKDANEIGDGTPIFGMIIAFILIVIDVVIFIAFQSNYGAVLIVFILALSLFAIFFRIFFMLLYSYIQIILLIIFSPVILAFEMIPGKSTFSSWIKNLLVNLATWPIFISLIFVVNALLKTDLSGQSNNFWAPPFLSSLNHKYFKIVISMAILFMITDLVKSIKNLTGIKPTSLNINLGAFTAGAAAITGGLAGPLATYNTFASFTQNSPLKLFRKDRTFAEREKAGKELVKNTPPNPQPYNQ